MAPYIENGICYDAYLWNPLDQGALGAYSAHALVTGAATGKVGDIVDAGDLGKFTIEEYYDGGTQVLLGEPLRFDKDNIAQLERDKIFKQETYFRIREETTRENGWSPFECCAVLSGMI